MGWLDPLRGQIVGLDTAPLIYFIEENPEYTALVDPFFEALDRREFKVVSSVITLTEVLVYPMRARDTNLAQQYRDILFDQENVATILVSPQIAELAAQTRAAYNLRSPFCNQSLVTLHLLHRKTHQCARLVLRLLLANKADGFNWYDYAEARL